MGLGDSSLPDLLKDDKSSHRRIEGVTDDTQIQEQSTHFNKTDGPLRLLKDAGPIEYLYKLKNLTIEATFVIVYQILSPVDVGLLNEGTRLDKKKATESNVETQTLLQNKILRVIKKNYVTKYLEMLAEIAELKDDRKKFYERFVKCMKLETAELLRFNTFLTCDAGHVRVTNGWHWVGFFTRGRIGEPRCRLASVKARWGGTLRYHVEYVV